MEVAPFIFGWFFFAVGVAIWVSGARDRTGFPLVGNVVDNKRGKRKGFYFGKAPEWFRPVIEYTSPTSGMRERLTSPAAFGEPFEIGAAVELRYNQERNEVRFPTRSTWVGVIIFMGIGLTLVAISLAGAWNALR